MQPDEKECPSCAETIKARATRCRFCGQDVGVTPRSLAAPQSPVSRWSPAHTRGVVVLGVAIVGLAALAGGGNGSAVNVEPVVAIEAPPDPAIAKAAAEKDADEHRKGFHCLSAWDGSNDSFVETVKAGLRDPDSFEHIETTIAPATAKGHRPIEMKYRARNGFGGMNVEEVAGVVDPETCKAVIITSVAQMKKLL